MCSEFRWSRAIALPTERWLYSDASAPESLVNGTRGGCLLSTIGANAALEDGKLLFQVFAALRKRRP